MATCGLKTAHSAGVQGKFTLSSTTVLATVHSCPRQWSSTGTAPAAPAAPPADSRAVHTQLSKPGWFGIINNPVLLSEGSVSRKCSLRGQMNARPFPMPQTCSAHFPHPCPRNLQQNHCLLITILISSKEVYCLHLAINSAKADAFCL